jgi:hypothetical protein
VYFVQFWVFNSFHTVTRKLSVSLYCVFVRRWLHRDRGAGLRWGEALLLLRCRGARCYRVHCRVHCWVHERVAGVGSSLSAVQLIGCRDQKWMRGQYWNSGVGAGAVVLVCGSGRNFGCGEAAGARSDLQVP